MLPPSTKESADTAVATCGTKRKLPKSLAFHLSAVADPISNMTKWLQLDGDNICETAYLTMKCYFEAVPKVDLDET